MIELANDNEARPSAGSIREPGRYPIDLIGPSSHTLVIEPGVGSLSIGPPQLGKKADLHVDSDVPIDWTVFDAFATPAGSPWPRFLYYTGSDEGFLDWAQQRPIEEMTWAPVLSADTAVNASQSHMHGLHIVLDQSGERLSLKLPQRHFRLSVSGDLSRFSATGDMPSSLTLAPRTGRRKNDTPFLLPDLGELHQVTNLYLQNAPLGQPISLKCLDRFPNLDSLNLWGNFCDLDLLAQHTRLTNLELRFMPDLGDLPPLNAWPLLDRFIAYNVEESAGKRLRQQMKARAATRPWAGYASVSQLRKPEWWATEYGRPFSSWPKRLAKQANEAYNVAEAALAHARSFADAEAAITAFTVRFNSLKGIETTEREDLGEAVWQLSQSDHLIGEPIPEELAQRWFDAARDY
ncbi:leucine-rich repeat domain-containing protein [Paenibacillus sp. NPDC058071]|uniref:leucine-rich repeat domain-containing protein n=1 Tax=Paenibacillus sp. NPDC058071 TaxID=3346326 RepID=UPI0036DAD263